MGKSPSLDSLGEIYPGFVVHRLQLKVWLGARAEEVWQRAFAKVRQTEDFYQRSDAAVARETMRILLAARPLGKGSPEP